jgi:hypothetical protein
VCTPACSASPSATCAASQTRGRGSAPAARRSQGANGSQMRSVSPRESPERSASARATRPPPTSVQAARVLAARLGADVVLEPRPGFGWACYAGLRAARADVVCFLDADGSLDPAELPRVTEPVTAGERDLVLGARRASAGAWPLHARVANRALALELRRRAGVHLRDIGPMRAARRADLLALDVRDRRFGWPLEMVLRAAAAGWRIAERDVSYAPRRGGRSKVTGTVRGTARVVRDMAVVMGAG